MSGVGWRGKVDDGTKQIFAQIGKRGDWKEISVSVEVIGGAGQSVSWAKSGWNTFYLGIGRHQRYFFPNPPYNIYQYSIFYGKHKSTGILPPYAVS